VIGIAIATDDDLGMRAALAHVEDADLLDLLAGPHAAGAENAERHVMLDHHIAGTFVTLPGSQRADVAHRDVVVDDVALEVVPRMLAPAIREMLTRIALEQHLEDATTIRDRLL
jgi:hypothetical protein